MNETNRQNEEQARRGNGRDRIEAAPASERFTERAHEAVDRAGQAAGEIESGLRSRARHAAETAAGTEERIRSEARDRAVQARRLIRSNPFATAGIAFAAGVVLSALLRR